MIIIYITSVMLMRVIQSVYSKKASLLLPNGMCSYIKYVILYNALAALFALATIVIYKDFSGFNIETVCIASCAGIFLALGSVFSILSLISGTIVLNSVFATAGIIIPCVLGIFVFSEPLSIIQIICIILLIVSAGMIIKTTGHTYFTNRYKTIFYLAGTLISNGLVMFFQKMFGVYVPNGNVSLFSLLTFLFPTIVLIAFVVFYKNKSNGEYKKSFPRKIYVYVFALAFAVFVIQQVVTILTPQLSSAVLFAVVNGGATVVAAFVGAIVYKEKLNIKSCMGIIIALVSMVGIKLFE